MNFAHPEVFSEKISYRKLYGNMPFYARLADKHRVREYVAQRVGSEVLVPQLGVYNRLTPEILASLPSQFILKANHASKWNQLVRDKSRLDQAATIATFNTWMTRRFGARTEEYHYALIEPKIVAEQLLITSEGDIPVDYGIFCFNNSRGFECGVCVEIGDTRRHVHFDHAWNVLDDTCTGDHIKRYRQPRNFARMLEIARTLSLGIDFVRVDLYNVDGRISFGEMTFTPVAGLQKVANPARDALRASQWEIDRTNPMLYRQ